MTTEAITSAPAPTPHHAPRVEHISAPAPAPPPPPDPNGVRNTLVMPVLASLVTALLMGFLTDWRAVGNARAEVDKEMALIKRDILDLQRDQIQTEKRLEKLEGAQGSDKTTLTAKIDAILKLQGSMDTKMQLMSARQERMERDIKGNAQKVAEVEKNIRRLERKIR